MKIIDDEKVKTYSLEYANKNHFRFINNIEREIDIKAFKSGVDFAETELINLAIEFRKWPYYYEFDSVEKNFEKFIQKYKSKTI